MMNQLNWRFLAKCGLGLVLVLAGVHGVHMFQMGRHLSHLKGQAEANATEGNLDRSALYYGRYVAQRPDDLEAAADYGLVLYRQARTPAQRWRAYTLLQDVLLRKPEMARIRVPLADLAAALGQYAEGARVLEPLRGTVAERSELEQTLAWCYLGDGKTPRAEEAFLKSIEYGPQRTEPYLQLADLYRRERREASANQLLQRMIDANPGSAGAYRARADWLLRQGRLEQAAADYEEAVLLAPRDVELWLQSAEVARGRDRIDECRLILKRGLKVNPNHPRLMQFLAWLELDNDQPADSKTTLAEALEKNPGDAELLALRAELAFDEGKPADARRHLEALRGIDKASPLAHHLEGRDLAARGEWIAAARRLEAVSQELSDRPAWQSRAWLALARCYEASGDHVRDLPAVQRAVQSDPAGRPARLALARLLADRGADEGARALLQPIQAGAAPLPSAWPLLARVLISLNEKALAARSGNVRWEDAEQALDNARADKSNAEVALLTAHMWEVRRDAARANTALQQAVADFPRDARVQAALVDHALAKGDDAEAKRLLDKGPTNDGAAPRLARARWLVQTSTGTAALARQLFELGDDIDALPAADRAALFVGLSEQLQRLGAAKELAALAEKWSAATPHHLGAPVVLFDLALRRNDGKAAERQLDRLRQIEGDDGVQWRCGKAMWLIGLGERAGLAQARTLLQDAAARQPDWARLALTQARLDDIEGRTAEATRHYQQAFNGGERAPWVAERLVLLLVEQNRPLDADRVLRTFQQNQPLTPALARLGADIARQSGEWPRARELAQLAVPADSRDYREHLWLAEIQELGGFRDEARATLDRLLKLAPDIPECWVALVRHQARGGQHEQVRAAIEQARKKVPPEQHAWLLARCQEAVGDLITAEGSYRAAIEQSPGEAVLHERLARLLLYQDEPSRAIPELRWLADPRNQAPRATLHWARRTLALASVGLLAAEPNLLAGREQQESARRLLELNRTQPSDELADRRAGLFLDMLVPSKKEAAVAALKETKAQAPLAADEQYRLALLLGVLGDAEQSRGLLFSLVTAHKHDGQYLAAYTRAMLARGGKAEARTWFDSLVKVEPESRRVAALKKELE